MFCRHEYFESGLGILSHFPKEIVLWILHFVDGTTLLKVIPCLSTRLYQLSKDDTILWREICQERKISIEYTPPHCSYKWRWAWMSKMLRYKHEMTGIATLVRHGYTYEGEFVNGHKHGYGRYIWDDGNVYTGEWRDDLIEGYGTHVWKCGDIYSGNWLNNCKHGYGKHTWGEGVGKKDNYEGYWKDDIQDGDGIYTWNDGRIYRGSWNNHLCHGQGHLEFPDGSSYDGEWKNKYRHGQGKQIWMSGRVYEGQWKEDRPVDTSVTGEEWDGFFLKTKEEQRAYVRQRIPVAKC